MALLSPPLAFGIPHLSAGPRSLVDSACSHTLARGYWQSVSGLSQLAELAFASLSCFAPAASTFCELCELAAWTACRPQDAGPGSHHSCEQGIAQQGNSASWQWRDEAVSGLKPCGLQDHSFNFATAASLASLASKQRYNVPRASTPRWRYQRIISPLSSQGMLVNQGEKRPTRLSLNKRIVCERMVEPMRWQKTTASVQLKSDGLSHCIVLDTVSLSWT